MIFRNASRTVWRSAARSRPSRNFSATAESVIEGNPSKEWVQKQSAIEHHAADTTELWRKISFYVAFPTTFLTVLWVRRVENEHAEHEKHIREEHGGELPAIPEYDYLNRRSKPFPWGMNTLFFNSHANKNMEEEA